MTSSFIVSKSVKDRNWTKFYGTRCTSNFEQDLSSDKQALIIRMKNYTHKGLLDPQIL